MSSAPNQLSFLPDDYLELKAQRRTNAVCASLFLVVAGAVGAAFYLTERMSNRIEAEYTDVMHRYADAGRPIEQFKRMQDQQRKMESQAALSASLLEKVPRSYLLAEITNALPANVSLFDFGLEAKVTNGPPQVQQYKTIFEQKKAEIEAAKIAAATANQAKRYEVYLKLTGVADNDGQVASFMSALSRSKLLRDVNLVVSDEFQPSPQDAKQRKFQIEMMLNPEAEVKPPEKKLNKLVNAVDDNKGGEKAAAEKADDKGAAADKGADKSAEASVK